MVRRFPVPAGRQAFSRSCVPRRPSCRYRLRHLTITGDPEDDAVLATARLGQVDYLVTGDRGLLALGNHSGVGIIRPRDLLIALSQ
ncbi:MAG: hypothetical protein U0531_04040 [Dehalococcoidia bacterium]